MRRLAAAVLLAVGCARPPEPGAGGVREDAGGAAPGATAGPGLAGERAGSAGVEQDPVAGALERAPILALRSGGAGGETPLETPLEAQVTLDGVPRWVDLVLAAQDRPLAYRRPLAFYRLARALGVRVVPAAAVRRIGIGEIAALVDGQPGAPELLHRLAIMNDGTVDALLTAPAPGPPGARWEPRRRRIVAFEEAPELGVWARWAASPTPAPGERSELVCDYIEALVLDYLAGYVLRRTVTLGDEEEGALILEDNAGAFPARVPARALDRFLRRLLAASRFPRSLHERLTRFGRAEAAAILAPGALPRAPTGELAALTGFEGWLVPPRTLVEMDERRMALLTLIEVKIVARGEAAVLSL